MSYESNPGAAPLGRVNANAFREFDKLPDSAGVRVPVVAALFSITPVTVWRWTKSGKLPAPTKRGGTTTWNVGALRRLMSMADQP